jgi:hypothetical protein
MQSRSTRSKAFRALGVLAALLLAAGVISPAFGAKALKKGKVKKIAKKQATNQINALVPGLVPTVGNPLFIQETELERFGPVTATKGEAEKTITTFGPFTLSLLCTDAGGFDRVQVQIATSAANSTYDSDDGDEDDFDPAPDDQDEDVDDNTATVATQESFDDDAEFWAGGPGGTPVFHGWVGDATNYGGADCWVQGWVLQTVPA